MSLWSRRDRRFLNESAVEVRAFEHWRWPMTFFRVDPSTPVRVEIATAGVADPSPMMTFTVGAGAVKYQDIGGTTIILDDIAE